MPDERVAVLAENELVDIKWGSGTVSTCWLRAGEKVVVNSSGRPAWVKRCGNDFTPRDEVLDLVQTEQPTQVSRPRTNTLLELAKRPMGQVQTVDGTNPKARLTAEQFHVNLNFGVSAVWYHGLKNTKVFQNQSQNQTAEGGRGGSSSSSSSSRAEGGDGGDGGDGGNGGGDSGGPENPDNSPPSTGGPEDPNNSNQGGA